jgi:simple sugar transport system substrate-binding protein
MKKYRIATFVKVAPEYHGWFARMQEGVIKFGQETGHNTFAVGPPTADENVQLKLVNETIAEGIDALCVVPLFPQVLELSLGKARRQGIVVISHEASNQRNADYDIEAFDNVAYGAHLMDTLAKYMGEEGEYVLFLGSLTGTSHSEWAKAAVNRQQEKYPQMSLLTRKLEDHDNQAQAYKKTKELLITYPNLKGIQGSGMTATIGIGQAIEEQGVQEKVAVVGTSLVSGCKQYLESGAINALCLWDPADTGYVMNKLALMVLEGQNVTDGMDLGISGYRKMKMIETVLYGEAWIDVTKDNMTYYEF